MDTGESVDGSDREHLVSEVRRALAHLDDPPYLEQLEIAARIQAIAQAPELSRGQALRRALRLAIASLDPRIESRENSLPGRAFQVLYRFAIMGESMVRIGGELGISSRQCYRELQRASEALAEILHGMLADRSRRPAKSTGGLRDELERLSSAGLQDVDIRALVAEAVQAVRHLAAERGLQVALELGTQSVRVRAHRVMLRQAVLNLLSHLVQINQLGTIVVRLLQGQDHADLSIEHHPRPDSTARGATSPGAVATVLFGSLGLSYTETQTPEGGAILTVSVPLSQRQTLLVIDDNEDAARLYQRYLSDQPYDIRSAASAQEALRLIDELDPRLVLLDIMMPDRDGWELLQAIRSREGAARIVVCSVINDPELAAALGADAFLHKPVSRATLIKTLGPDSRP